MWVCADPQALLLASAASVLEGAVAEAAGCGTALQRGLSPDFWPTARGAQGCGLADCKVCFPYEVIHVLQAKKGRCRRERDNDSVVGLPATCGPQMTAPHLRDDVTAALEHAVGRAVGAEKRSVRRVAWLPGAGCPSSLSLASQDLGPAGRPPSRIIFFFEFCVAASRPPSPRVGLAGEHGPHSMWSGRFRPNRAPHAGAMALSAWCHTGLSPPWMTAPQWGGASGPGPALRCGGGVSSAELPRPCWGQHLSARGGPTWRTPWGAGPRRSLLLFIRGLGDATRKPGCRPGHLWLPTRTRFTWCQLHGSLLAPHIRPELPSLPSHDCLAAAPAATVE